MRTYIIRRLLLIIPTLLLVSVGTFLIMRLIPGDIVEAMVAEADFLGGAPITREVIMHDLGLDAPPLVQYGRWVGVVPQADGGFSGLFQGSLGNSLWNRLPVTDEIADRLPVTIRVCSFALVIMVTMGLSIGIYSAIRQDTAGDYVGRSLATMLIALPGFWAALIVILIGSLWFNWAPPVRLIPFAADPIGSLRQFIIPSIVLGMSGGGTIMRMTRSMMLEVLRNDYIRTAWAKGLRERVVILRHTLKNALIPVITLIGIVVPGLIGGAVVIEIVFGLPGMGRLLVDAISKRDYTLISGIVFVMAGFLIVVNLIVDLTYAYLDPRIRYK